MEFKHISVMREKSIDGMRICDGGLYVDGTLGGGGHSFAILSETSDSRLIGIDRDAEAVEAAKKRLAAFGDRVTYVHDNFSNITDILDRLGEDKIDGAILDLGVSSYQLDNADRGFSYMKNAPLDMRMNKDDKLSAYEVVNEYPVEELVRVFYDYGEEKWSKRIAEFIDYRRKIKPVETTLELADIIKSAIPRGARQEGGHPAKRVFQAVRIEVNGELKILRNALCDFASRIKTGGRMAVITFHSLEDRIVKQTFAELAKGCICPPEFPVCVCGRSPSVKLITKKPVIPDSEEAERNPRAKSSKLRIIEKI